MKNRILSAFIIVLLLFFIPDAFANPDSILISSPKKEVSVTFPQAPFKTSESFYLPTGTKDVVSHMHVLRNGIEMLFSYFTTDYIKPTDNEKALSQWINQTGLKNQAQLISNKKTKSGEITIQKVTYKTLSNQTITAHFFVVGQTLFRVSVLVPPFIDTEGKDKKFLESIRFASSSPVISKTNIITPSNQGQTISSTTTTTKESKNWVVAVSNNFEALFPKSPAALNYHVTTGKNQTNVYNYVVENDNGISYIISYFQSSLIGFTEADKLLNERIAGLKGGEKIYELKLGHFKYSCTEYFFKNRHYYYKCRVFKKDNTYYQLLIKSDKKAVSNWENEYFFENFSLF